MTTKGKISVSLAVFLVPALALCFFVALTAPRPASSSGGSNILTIDSTTLTSNTMSATSGGQDIGPLTTQRGVDLDGTLRLQGSFGLAIAGNPFNGSGCGAGASKYNAGHGSFTVSEIDIALPAEGFPWVIGRSFNSLQEEPTSGSHQDSSGYQGVNWFQNSQPVIQLNSASDRIYLIYRADAFVEYCRVESTNYFDGTNGAAGVIEYKAGTPDTYVLTDQNSNEMTFFGFDTASGAADGQIWKVKDPEGNISYVGHATTASTAVSNGYSAKRITTAYDAEGRRFTYDYTSGRLDYVKAEVNSGGWTEVARVDYTYYSGSSNGPDGALEMATIKEYLTDSGVTVDRVKHYRYYKGSFNGPGDPGTDNLGHDGALKMVVGFEGCRDYDWENGTPTETFDDEFLSASDSTLKPYSDAYLEYNSSRQINLATFNGNCGCGSSSTDGTHEYEYETNSNYTDGTGYDDKWVYRTIIERPAAPDASWQILYFDEAMQPLSTVMADADPTTGSPNYWMTAVDRDSAGLTTEVATPAAVSAYYHSTGGGHNAGDYSLNASSGLIRLINRYSTGAEKGFVQYEKWKVGSSGTEYYQSGLEYDTSNKLDYGTPTDTSLYRPFVSTRNEYHTKTTSAGSSTNWTFTTTVHSSTLATKTVDVSEPAVSTSKNGSGTANSTSSYFDKSGRVTFSKDQDGHINHNKYENGQLTRSIRDADTSHSDFTGITIPTGFSSSGTEIHQKTTYSYDTQGRSDIVTTPDGRDLKTYYSRLKDHRVVTLSYSDYEDLTTDKYHGPVSYNVANHAGRSEASGLVTLTNNESTTALTGHIDETDADPVSAVDLGSVVSLSTRQFADAGVQLESERVYFDTPTTLPGTNGTNYDETTYEYDDLGRRTHATIPSGTISKTIFDIFGATKETWIGTVDGGGSDNMVKTAEYTYDAGSAGGNRYLTKTTQYVQDSTTDKRETSYSHDDHGRVLLVNSPQNPDALNKYDNNGRLLATGLYKTTPSPTADPTTTSSNRVGLTQTSYDELGRPYEIKQHKIDASDGSDDDNLTADTWYDKTGSVVKVDGEQLLKHTYDRLHRRTNTFVLASDNDSTYTNALDVTGDTVLEEYQTAYDDDHSQPLMTVSITRDHDDTTTTGALDTGTNLLKITASNVSGRVQITSNWYDRYLRLEDQQLVGTNGGSDYDRSTKTTPPSRSDSGSILLTTWTYATNGQTEEIEDPLERVTRFEYDDQLRQTSTIENYDATVNSGNPSNPDDNKTTAYSYTDQLLTSLMADLPGSTDDQTTTYTYGTEKGTSTGDSKIETGHLLHKVQYPDSSSGTDLVTHAYNAQGQLIWKKDQAGNILEYTYDTASRLTKEDATTIASGFDNTVDERNITYTDLGLVDKITQKDGATVTDEVRFTHDGWGLVSDFDQDHNSAVSGGGDHYNVSYAYAKATGGRNTIRATTLTYPSGTQINFNYTGTADSNASRVTSVSHGTSSPTTLATYTYQGFANVVRTDYDEADAFSSLFNISNGNFDNLDDFNRVTSYQWTKDLVDPTPGDVDFYDVDITYDEASNITRIEDNVLVNTATTPYVGFDVVYTKDDLNRLTRAQEGHWTGSALSPSKRDQDWTLTLADVMGEDNLDLNDDGDFLDTDEYQDDRTYNKANELLTRDTDSSGSPPAPEYSLTHDAVGNMTDDGKSYTYKYDVLGRLVKVTERSGGQNVVAEYRYNGLGHRIAELKDTDGDGDADSNDLWFHLVYDPSWRLIATYRLDSSDVPDDDPKEEFVYHQTGPSGDVTDLNRVILRDKDANTAWATESDGTLEDRIYYCQNWRGDVSAIIDDSGHMVEWVKYSAYGVPFGIPVGDCDSDFDRDSTDVNLIQYWINTSHYDVRGDTDLDGNVDWGDRTTVNASTTTLGRGALSDVGNRIGYAGYEYDEPIDLKYHARFRTMSATLGRWLQRDPGGYLDGPDLYTYVGGRPLTFTDPLGLSSGAREILYATYHFTWEETFQDYWESWCAKKGMCLDDKRWRAVRDQTVTWVMENNARLSFCKSTSNKKLQKRLSRAAFMAVPFRIGLGFGIGVKAQGLRLLEKQAPHVAGLRNGLSNLALSLTGGVVLGAYLGSAVAWAQYRLEQMECDRTWWKQNEINHRYFRTESEKCCEPCKVEKKKEDPQPLPPDGDGGIVGDGSVTGGVAETPVPETFDSRDGVGGSFLFWYRRPCR